MSSGDVYWAELPARSGRAQAGRRPVIVVQGSAASAKLSTVLVVPLTTQQDALRFPGTVFVDPDTENGLRRPSVALVFQLTVVDVRFLNSRIGAISEETLQAVCSAFDEITDRQPGSYARFG